jgi:hypothetical protein
MHLGSRLVAAAPLTLRVVCLFFFCLAARAFCSSFFQFFFWPLCFFFVSSRVPDAKLWGTCHFQATGLAPGCRYEFRLRAHSAAGFSGWSPTSALVATRAVFAPPQPPAPLFAAAALRHRPAAALPSPASPASPASAAAAGGGGGADAVATITVYVGFAAGPGSFRGPAGRASNSAVGDSGASRVSAAAPNGQEESFEMCASARSKEGLLVRSKDVRFMVDFVF